MFTLMQQLLRCYQDNGWRWLYVLLKPNPIQKSTIKGQKSEQRMISSTDIKGYILYLQYKATLTLDTIQWPTKTWRPQASRPRPDIQRLQNVVLNHR